MQRSELFIVHYRGAGLAGDYFDPDHPQNRGLGTQEWMSHMLSELSTRIGKPASPTDFWLFSLRYYLDTPHNTLLDEGQKWTASRIARIQRNPHEPRLFVHPEDGMKAVAGTYEIQGERYFLGIWQAADEREFILTSHSFGLWEGMSNDVGKSLTPEVHRLLVVSPRIVIVLRSNIANLIGGPLSKLCTSSLADIPLDFPHRTRAPGVRLDDDPFVGSQLRGDVLKLRSRYKATTGQKDTFKFKMTKLTAEQTDEVNFTLLRSLQPESAGLSFLNPKLCAEMLGCFGEVAPRNGVMDFRDKFRGPLFKPLQWLLTEPEEEATSPPLVVPLVMQRHIRILSWALRIHYVGKTALLPHEDSSPAITFISLLETAFPSEYDRAYQLHLTLKNATNRSGLSAAYRFLSTHYAVKNFRIPPRSDPEQSLTLVHNMPESKSKRFFGEMAKGSKFGRTQDSMSTLAKAIPCLLMQAVYIGTADLVMTRAPTGLYFMMQLVRVSLCSDEEKEKEMVLMNRKSVMLLDTGLTDMAQDTQFRAYMTESLKKVPIIPTPSTTRLEDDID